MIRTYLDWMISVPWSEASDEVLDPVGARKRCSTQMTRL